MYPFTATHTISLVGLELLVHLYIFVNRTWAFVNAEYFICNCLLTNNYQNYEQKSKCSPLCMIPYMCQHETDSKETKISKAKEILQERHNQLNWNSDSRCSDWLNIHKHSYGIENSKTSMSSNYVIDIPQLFWIGDMPFSKPGVVKHMHTSH